MHGQIQACERWETLYEARTSKSPPRKVLDYQDADTSSYPVASGLHIEDQVYGKDS